MGSRRRRGVGVREMGRLEGGRREWVRVEVDRKRG